jgi:hypothetical protein
MLSGYVLGAFYPGYNLLTQTMSVLGVSGSPVARTASIWWVLCGVFFRVFALGYRKVYKTAGPPYTTVSWLIVLYGAGEGLGSGIFPGNRIGGHLTPVGFVHISLGVSGVLAIMALPFLLLGTFPKNDCPGMFYFSLAVAVTGIITVLLFDLSRLLHATGTILAYEGLWQRVFVFIYYAYLMVIAHRMLRYGMKIGQTEA